MRRERALKVVLVFVGLLYGWRLSLSSASRSLIAFTAWSSFAHAGVMALQTFRNLIPRKELGGVAFFIVLGIALIVLAPTRQPAERVSAVVRRLVHFLHVWPISAPRCVRLRFLRSSLSCLCDRLGFCSPDCVEKPPCRSRRRHSTQQHSPSGHPGPVHGALERLSARTNAPLNVAPTKAPLAREYVRIRTSSFKSVFSEECRPTGPPATDASRPISSLLESSLCIPFSLLMTITRSTASAPICVPQLPPAILMNAGAPALRRPARGRTLAVLGSEDESAFYEMGYDRHALCPLHSLLRNAPVRRGHDLVQHFGRVVQPVDSSSAL